MKKREEKKNAQVIGYLSKAARNVMSTLAESTSIAGMSVEIERGAHIVRLNGDRVFDVRFIDAEYEIMATSQYFAHAHVESVKAVVTFNTLSSLYGFLFRMMTAIERGTPMTAEEFRELGTLKGAKIYE